MRVLNSILACALIGGTLTGGAGAAYWMATREAPPTIGFSDAVNAGAWSMESHELPDDMLVRSAPVEPIEITSIGVAMGGRTLWTFKQDGTIERGGRVLVKDAEIVAAFRDLVNGQLCDPAARP